MSEDIYGLDTDADTAARIMSTFVRNDWIEMEPALYRGKWFDYRFMNPVQATYLYAHEFLKFYRMTYAKNFSSKKGAFVTPIKPTLLFHIPDDADKKTVTKIKQRASGVWRGRMFADAMGMPYAEYLEFAFHCRMRYWKQPQPPRPQQLYSDLVTDLAASAWDERQGAKLFFSRLPQYKNGSYELMQQMLNGVSMEGKMLHQDAHHEWLFQQVDRRHDNPELIANLIWGQNVLPVEKVRSRLGEEVFDRVMLYADRYPSHA